MTVELGWEARRIALCGLNEKKNRARIGQHPEPGGLSHQTKQIKEETASWQ